MWRLLTVGLVILAVTVLGFSLIDRGSGDVRASAALLPVQENLEAFTRAVGPWDWQFPRDHGAHPDFQTEWWYYTGNVADADGRRFGFQFTLFRRAIDPTLAQTVSEWRSGQVYMAHFTVSDLENGRFYHSERYSRGGAGLAGAVGEPRYRAWLEDWEVLALDDEATQFAMTAAEDDFAVDLVLEQVKPIALQGDNGLSAKSSVEGNASYYYSMTRLPTTGTLTIEGETFIVSGNTWMDHEFSTSALGTDALGWDWFGLIFDNDHELMVGQIRQTDGERDPNFGGLMVYPDGSTQYLAADDFTIEALDTWESPHTGAIYPSGWRITIRGAALNQTDDLVFTATPMALDQELNSGDIAYWEGAVRIDGGVTGYGYAELTGYANTMTGRF
ncbi:MAG: lipocalin-like domain-containing protein [Anaerolineae bacterium]